MTGVLDRAPVSVAARPRRWEPAAGVGAAAAVIGLVRLLFAGDPFTAVVNEDAIVFLADVRRFGWGSFLHTYAGYAHWLPRTIAEVGSWLPLTWFVPYAATVSLLAVGALAAFTYDAARPLVGDRWAVGAALAPVLAPAGWMTVGAVANLQWFLLPAALWACTVGRGRRAVVVAALAALSSPLAVVVLPGAWAWHRRDAWRSGPVRAVVVGLAVQAVMMLAAPSSVSPVVRIPGIDPGVSVGNFFFGVVGSATISPPGEALGLLVAPCVLVALVACRRRAMPVTMVGTGVGLFLLTNVISGYPHWRYDAAAAALVLGGLVVALALTDNVMLRLTACTLLGFTVALGFPAYASRLGSAPPWSAQLAHARSACTAGHHAYLSDGSARVFWGHARWPC